MNINIPINITCTFHGETKATALFHISMDSPDGTIDGYGTTILEALKNFDHNFFKSHYINKCRCVSVMQDVIDEINKDRTMNKVDTLSNSFGVLTNI